MRFHVPDRAGSLGGYGRLSMGAGSANADGEFGLFDGIGVKRALDDVRAALQRSEADAEVAVARFLAVYRAALDVPATAADWDLLDPLETLQRSMVAMGEDLGASTLGYVVAQLIVRRK